jgi:hypothetical protein
MRCPVQNGNPDILLDYCARRLAPEPTSILVQHMAVCADCRRVAEAQQQVWSALDAWEPVPVSEDFDERLYARISSEERRSFWSRILGERLTWKPALSLAGACATLALAVLLNVPDPAPAPLPETTRIESLEPEQIERAVEDMDMLRQFSTSGHHLKTL